MKLNRAEFLALLKTLRPALANNPKQQALNNVWFDGKHASAFNGMLGIRVAFETDFTGGVLGKKLIGVIERSRAPEVRIAVRGSGNKYPGELRLKIGAALMMLEVAPIEDWLFEAWLSASPVPNQNGHVVDNAFRDTIRLLLPTVGNNPENRATWGITVIPNGKAVDLYSTNSRSLSWVRLNTEQKVFSDRLILPTDLCERIVALTNPAEIRLEHNTAYCLTHVDLGQRKARALIMSNLVTDDHPVSFDEIIRKFVTNAEGSRISRQLRLCMNRALVLLADEPARLEVIGDGLRLYARAPYGVVDDVVAIGDHPEVKTKVDLALVRRAFDRCDRITIAEDGIVMTGPKNFTHIIGAA